MAVDPGLAQTDPELAAYFGSFATEVSHHGDLDARTRLLTQLGATVAVGAVRQYTALAGDALDAGITPVEIKEVVYQAVPYAGMARVLDFLHATNELFTGRGITLPLPGQATTTPDDRAEKGLAVQKQIVGSDTVDAMYANAPADEAHIQRYLSANCFGDHYTRGTLDVPTRELLTLAVLTALGGADPQVAGHVRANLNVGNDRATMIEVVTQLLPYIGYPRTLNGLRAIDTVAPVEA